MAKTKIEWADKVWNPSSGCTKVSAGCKNCYAERIANRYWGERKFTEIELHSDRLFQPLHWRKPSHVFVDSMSDLFHPEIPFTFILQVFNIILKTPQHRYLILTKRPERAVSFYDDTFPITKIFPENIWIGVSVEDQEAADKRIPVISKIQANRFISAEPLLSPVWLADYLHNIDWVIVGGESGSGCRPMEPEWAESIVKECRNAEIPVFVKQLGGFPDPRREIKKFPRSLQIRQTPE